MSIVQQPAIVSVVNPLTSKPRRIGVFKAKKERVPVRNRTEDQRNSLILSGLRGQYGPEKTLAILEQANSIFHIRNMNCPNNPESYELLESGLIDEAIEGFGGAAWVIGRPREN